MKIIILIISIKSVVLIECVFMINSKEQYHECYYGCCVNTCCRLNITNQETTTNQFTTTTYDNTHRQNLSFLFLFLIVFIIIIVMPIMKKRYFTEIH